MTVAIPSPPDFRRHSFSSLNIARQKHRHESMPKTDTRDPDNPIPPEPRMCDASTSFAPSIRDPSTSPRSSGEGLALEGQSDDSSVPSTPPSEPAEDVIRHLPTDAHGRSKGRQSSPTKQQKRRRASTQLIATNNDDIRRLLGDGNGTKFLQKYCCGEGCCMLETLPYEAGDGAGPVVVPENAAFRALNLRLGGITLDTPLTKTADLPEDSVAFAPVRKQSIAEKLPGAELQARGEAAVNTHPPEYVQPHPPYSVFSAPVYGARQLTKPGAEKRTFHFDIDVTDYPTEGGVDFKVGGAVGICPPNDPAVVTDILDQLGIPRYARDRPIRLLTSGGRWPTIWGDDKARELLTTRRELLTWCADISSVPPTKPLLRLFAEYAEAQNEAKILLYLASAQGQAAFCDLRSGPHITLQQLLYAFPSSKPPLEKLLGVLKQLMPRFYSLSNDPHVSSARDGLAGRRLIEMAVTIHETPNWRNGQRTGVGSGYLERVANQFITAEEEEKEEEESAQDTAGAPNPRTPPGRAGRDLALHIPLFRGLMSNPLSQQFSSDGPMMLIGAGVGMAPFRGFILNRLAHASCANKIWLVQGVRDSLLDEIYSGELGAHEGEIKRVVQSRAPRPPPVGAGDEGVEAPDDDEREPVRVTDEGKRREVARYVQDEVRLQADIVWFVVNAVDGRVFVCGSSKGMGEGVEEALVEVAMAKGNLDADTARDFWRTKRTAGQYIAETW